MPKYRDKNKEMLTFVVSSLTRQLPLLCGIDFPLCNIFKKYTGIVILNQMGRKN